MHSSPSFHCPVCHNDIRFDATECLSCHAVITEKDRASAHSSFNQAKQSLNFPGGVTDFKAAVCPACGGNLRLSKAGSETECVFCGVKVLMPARSCGATLPTVDNLLQLARAAVEVKNFQQAYRYYTKTLELDVENGEAWFGKGIAAGKLRNMGDSGLEEMTFGIKCPRVNN